MKQIILINNCDCKEYERIKAEIEKGLKSGEDTFTICGTKGQLVSIEVIELPNTNSLKWEEFIKLVSMTVNSGINENG